MEPGIFGHWRRTAVLILPRYRNAGSDLGRAKPATYDYDIFRRIAEAGGDIESKLREYLDASDVFEAVPEFEAQRALEAELPLISSAADVAAVVEHAAAQGQRGDLGGSHSEIHHLRELIDVLTVKLYGRGISAD